MEINYVSHGIGNRFENSIELNKHLKDYPQLHNAVLAHELSHTDNLFSLKDLKIDLGSSANSMDVLWFMLRHPLSFTQLLPFYYTRKHGLVYDINLILIYFVTICFLSLVIYLGLVI